MTISDTITTQVKSIVRDVRVLPETFKNIDIADLQKQAQGIAQAALGTATSTYAGLAKKGEDFFDKAEDSVEDVVEDVTKQAKGFAADAQKIAFGYVSIAKAQVTKVTSKAPTTTRKAAETVDATVKRVPEPAKKAPAKKAPAAKKAPVAKKAPAAKQAPAAKKVPAAKKAPVASKTTTVKKAPAAKKTVTPAAAKKTTAPAAAKTAPAVKKAPAATTTTTPVEKAPTTES